MGTDIREKASAVLFVSLIVASVFGATMAFSGSAAAVEPTDLSVDNSPEVRADDPGSFLIFSFDAEDGNADTYTVNIRDLQIGGVDNLDGANLAAGVTGSGSGAMSVTGVGTIDPDGDSTPEEITVAVNGAGSSGTQSNVAVGLGTDATGAGNDPSGAGVATANTNALQTEDVASGFGYTLEISDSSGNSDIVSDSIDADTIDVTSISPDDGSADLGGTEVVTISAQYASDGEAVQELVDPSLTVVQPDLSNRTETNTGSLTGLSGTVDITVDGLNHGDNDLAVQSGQFTDTSGAATNDDAQRDNNALNVDGYRLELDTPEDEVGGVDTVLFNSQQAVNGDIFLTADGANRQVLADDRIIDYKITEPTPTGGAVLASDDTGNGQFTVRESYDETTTSGGEERLDGLSYSVSVTDGSGETDISAISEEAFQTRLDINFQIDGQPASEVTPTFDSTVQISGTVEDGSGNAISGYRVAVKPYDDTGTLITGEPGTTTTGNNGEFSFTARLPDAVEEPNIDNVVGASGSDAIGFHLGTHLGASPDVKSTDTAAGPPPHPFVRYQAQPTQPQQANIDISQVNQNSVNFQDTYKIQATDADGDALSGATVVVTGEFSGETGPGREITIANSNGSFTGTPALEDVDGTSPTPDTVAFAVTTNADGFADVQFTPLAQQITANLTFERTSDIDTTESAPQTIEGDPSPANDGSFSVPTEPDVAGVETFAAGPAAPVNINNFDVEDEVNSPSGFPNSIFSDAGPEQVEVLPLQGIAGGDVRIEAGDRLGKDTFSDLGGMTQYRVSFDLQDENANDIRPSALDTLEVTGAGVNATFIDADDNDVLDSPADEPGVVSATETGGTYTIIVRPTEVEAANEELEITVDTEDDAPVSEAVATDGLDITQFTTDGSPATVVNGSSTVDVSAFVNTPSEIPVNNGRVRVSELRFISGSVQPDSLGDVDGRQATTNINNGSYSFNNLDIGPRGIDTDADGIGEQISRLTFTAYQYNDTDSDGSVNLENNEVTAAAVDTVGIRLTRNLQTDYNESIDFTGLNDDGEYTLTRGVEYDRIEFNLTDQDGNPIDLTQGIDGVTVSDLDDLVADDIVNLQTTDNSGNTVDLNVRFADAPANDPASGTYVIEDIAASSAANVASTSSSLNTGDAFVIDSDGTDTAPQTFALDIETPDRSQATNLTQSAFVAANAQLSGDVVGVAGTNVPNATSSSALSHSGSDNLNTNVSDINTTTIGVDRTYRVNATVTTALGTPLNGSEFSEVRVDNTGAESGTIDYVPVSGVSGVNTGAGAGSEVEINNQDGFFQFDYEPTDDTDSDGRLSPTFDVEAQFDVNSAPQGQSDITGTPPARNPVVEVYDRSGAELPTSDDGDQILAQDVQNRLRVEAFPASPNDFVLPDGQPFGFDDPKSEDTAGATTTLSDEVITSEFDEGQLGFIRVTPTGTGNAIISLTPQVDGGTSITPTVRNTDGELVHFDVLSSNLQVDITLSTTSVEAGQNVTATLSQVSTDERLPENTRVSLVNPDGTEVNSALTNADGEAELAVPVGTTGTFTLETRPAGFEPNSVDLAVTEVDRPTATVTFDDKTVQNGTEEVTVDSANFTRADGSDGNYVVVVHTIDEFGAPVGSVSAPIGASGDLTGAEENITVDLTAADGPINSLTENVTLRAMLHTTANDSAFGSRLGNAIDGIEPGDETDDANITVEATAQTSVTFNDQPVTNGAEEVIIDSANFTRADGSAGDYVVVVHTIDEFGAPVGSVSAPIGASGDLTGAEENITVDLTAADGPINSLTENVTLRAMLHTTANDSAFGSRLGNAIDGIEPGDETDDANITVEDPAEFQLSGLDQTEVSVQQGDEIDVSVTVTNEGDLEGTQNVTLSIGENEVDEQVTLGAGENTTVSFDNVSTSAIDAPANVTYTVSTDDADVSGNLTVERGLATYQDENGDTSIDQLRDAITDFRNDDIGIDLLRGVIDSFRESQ